MPRGINEIEQISMAVMGRVIQGHALRLDGDAALSFQVHGIQNLRLHLTFAQAAAHLDQAVRQGRFTVINVGNDREVPYVLQFPQWLPRAALNIKKALV